MFTRTSMTVLLTLCLSTIATAQNSVAPTHRPSKWYDVREWFSSNDYIPSDEAIEKVKPNEKNHTPNQYIDRDDDGEYEVMKKFFDGNGDGVNDTVAVYTDTNEDGTYDKLVYHSTLAGEIIGKNNTLYKTEDLDKYIGRRKKVTGEVVSTDLDIKQSPFTQSVCKLRQDDGKECFVNLGNDDSSQIFKGVRITAWGPLVNDGDDTVLVATETQVAGKERQVVHHGRTYSGVVQSTSEADVAGEKHLVGKVKTENGKMFTVDVLQGPSMSKFKEGQQVTISGVPISVEDRLVLMAINVEFPEKK